MKLHTRLGAVLALLLLPLFSISTAIAQTKSGPLTITSTGCVNVSVDGQAQIAINVSGGSWSGTIQPKASIAGQAVANVQVTPSTSSTAQSTITANGLYTATVAGYQQFWLCGNTVTNTATIFTVTTTRSASGRNGGSGSTPGGAAGGDLSGTYPNPTVVNINGTAFSGTNGHLVSFGAANIPADSGLVAANQVNAVAPGAGLCHFAGSTQTCTSSPVVNADITNGTIDLTTKVTGVLPAANGGSIGFLLESFCFGTIGTANGSIYGLAPASNTTACTAVIGASNDNPPLSTACTAQNLYVRATLGGALAGSGVTTLYKNNVATALTCTLGNTSPANCSDTTHTVAMTTSDFWSVRVTTAQATDTTANVRASFQCK